MKRGAEKLETNEPFWQRRSGGTNGRGGIRQQRPPPRLQRVLLLRQNVGRKSTKPRSTFTHTRNTRRWRRGKKLLFLSYCCRGWVLLFFLVAPHVLNGNAGWRGWVPCDARCNEYLLLPLLLAIPFFGDADVIVIRRAFASAVNERVPFLYYLPSNGLTISRRW